MPEIKRRSKGTETEPEKEGAPRKTRVTLARDVSSRYRKIMPRGGRATLENDGGSPPRRRPGSGPLGRPEKSPRSTERAARPVKSGLDAESFTAIAHRGLPEATKQLAETQALILKTAETMLHLAEEMSGAHGAGDLEKAGKILTQIFENMGFQDLAGQRLLKVEDFLKSLKEALKKKETFNAPGKRFSRPPLPRRDFGERKPYGKDSGPAKKPGGPKKERPAKNEKPPKKSRLKGPQAEGGGLGQGDIDALLKNL